MQGGGGFLALPEPLRLVAGGVEHGEAGALAVGLFKQRGEQALGLGEGAVAAGGGGGVDDYQPEFAGVTATRAALQIGQAPWAAA